MGSIHSIVRIRTEREKLLFIEQVVMNEFPSFPCPLPFYPSAPSLPPQTKTYSQKFFTHTHAYKQYI